MDKTTLRKEYLEKRKSLSRSQYWSLNDGLIEEIKKVFWQDYKLVHIFLPINKNNEIDTFSVIEYFNKEHPKLEIVLPRTNFDDLSIENVLFDPIHTILGRNKLDIPEPIHGEVISPKEVDAIFLPLLAFDKRGNRVGYGKGFYDRFLTRCRPDIKKIGLSLFDPIDKIEDLNKYDISMDMCLTPEKTWNFEISRQM